MDHVSRTAPRPVVARINKKKLLLILVVGVAAYAVLFAFLDKLPKIVMGVAVAVASAYAVKELLTNKTRVVIDRRGVLDSRLGVGAIAWADITRVYVREYKNVDLICLEVADPGKYLGGRSATARAALKIHDAVNGISPFHINPAVLDTDIDVLYDSIVQGCSHYNSAAGPVAAI